MGGKEASMPEILARRDIFRCHHCKNYARFEAGSRLRVLVLLRIEVRCAWHTPCEGMARPVFVSCHGGSENGDAFRGTPGRCRGRCAGGWQSGIREGP